MKLSRLFLLASCLGAIPIASATVLYNLADDFSPSNNPNGVWSYGTTPTLGGTLSLYTVAGNNGGDYWTTSGVPLVYHNGTASPVSFTTIVVGPGQAGFHPGPSGEQSVFRFTSPSASTLLLDTAFSGLDTVGTTTDVHVLLNGVSLFDGNVNGYGAGPTFSSLVTLGVGDTLDFVVGFGNGSYAFDMTGVAATLSTAAAVPEPSTWTMIALGGLGSLLVRGRRS